MGWVTIKGVHVLIGAEDIIIKGPAGFVGKTVSEVSKDSAKGKSKSGKSAKVSTKSSDSKSSSVKLDSSVKQVIKDNNLKITDKEISSFVESHGGSKIGKLFDDYYEGKGNFSENDKKVLEAYGDLGMKSSRIFESGVNTMLSSVTPKSKSITEKKDIKSNESGYNIDDKVVPLQRGIQRSLSKMDTSNMSDGEIMDYLSSKGINSVEDAIKSNGFNGYPKVMKGDKFDSFISEGGIELSRGISAKDKETFNKYNKELKSGDFYVAGGEALFGKGMYSFRGNDKAMALDYAKGNGGGLITMGLPKDAKILDIKGKDGLSSKIPKNSKLNNYLFSNISRTTLENAGYTLPREPKLPKNEKDLARYFRQEYLYENRMEKIKSDYIREHSGLSKSEQKQIFDTSRGGSGHNVVTASKGYDAIRLSPEYVNEYSKIGNHEIYIILNRSKLVIKED